MCIEKNRTLSQSGAEKITFLHSLQIHNNSRQEQDSSDEECDQLTTITKRQHKIQDIERGRDKQQWARIMYKLSEQSSFKNITTIIEE